MAETVRASCLEVERANLNVTGVTRAELGPPQPGGAWLEIRRDHGLGGAARVYREVLTGVSSPAAAHLVAMTLSRAG